MRLAAPEGQSVMHPAFQGQRLLVAEDEPLLAIDLRCLLEHEGATVIEAYSVGQALGVVETSALSASVVDIRLGNEDAWPLCDALRLRRVPFVFYTGQPDAATARWQSIPVVDKPTTSSIIVGAIQFAISAESHNTGSSISDEANAKVRSADQRIADGEERIARIRRLIVRLQATGFDTSIAEKLVITMTDSLYFMHNHRRLVASKMYTRSMVSSPKV